MKLNRDDKYVRTGITVFFTALACMICFFILYNIPAIAKGIGYLLGVLQPFIYGGVIAYLLAPLCRRLEKALKGTLGEKRASLANGLAVAVSFLAGALVLALLTIIVIPRVWESVVSLVNVLPGQIKSAYQKLYAMLDHLPDVQAWVKDVSEQTIARLESWSKTDLLPTATSLLSNVAAYMSNTFVMIKDVLLGLVIAVYLLASRRRLSAQIKMLLRGALPIKWVEWIYKEMHYVDRMFNGFFMAKLLDSALVGILCFIGCLILGLPSAPLLSVIIGVTNIIPMFGPFIGAIPCTLLLLLENPMHALIFVIFVVVLMQLDGNVLGPRIMGNSTGLSGFWVTVAIVVFGGIWGVTGMLVGVPLMAVLYDAARRLIYRGLSRRGSEEMITEYNAAFHPPKTIRLPIRIKKTQK